MAKPVVTQAYRLLAQHYDRIFNRDNLDWFLPAHEHVLGKILTRVRSACDLCCGTGTTAVELARRGIRMYGVDLSPTMCRLARAKARRNHLAIRVLRGDMRSFRLPEQVDLVTCEYDAINHVPRKQDLAKVARAVARALRPGGYFYFDANSRLAFEKLWPRASFTEVPGVVMVLHGGYDRRRDKAWCDAEWFLREGSRWKRRRERVEEVCWTPAEVRRIFRQAGFDQIQACDGAEFIKAEWMAPGYRTFYLIRKSPISHRETEAQSG